MPVRRPGFTLIELLVVIAIIAIIAAILFPVFIAAKQKAQTSTCISNLKQLSQAMRTYADSNHGYLPWDWPPATRCTAAQVPNWCGSIKASEWVYPERGQLWPYVRNRKVYLCPSDFGRRATNITPPDGSGLTQKDFPLSYSMNSKFQHLIADTVPNHSRVMLLIHENRGEKADDRAINDGTYVPNLSGQDYPGIVHYNGTTVAYLDGHAVWKSRNQIISEYKFWMPPFTGF